MYAKNKINNKMNIFNFKKELLSYEILFNIYPFNMNKL